MGEFWAPGAEIWLFKKKNMDRSIDLAVQRMFWLLIIDEGPSLSMTDGRVVAHFKLVWLSVMWLWQKWLDLSTLTYMYLGSLARCWGPWNIGWGPRGSSLLDSYSSLLDSSLESLPDSSSNKFPTTNSSSLLELPSGIFLIPLIQLRPHQSFTLRSLSEVFPQYFPNHCSCICVEFVSYFGHKSENNFQKAHSPTYIPQTYMPQTKK